MSSSIVVFALLCGFAYCVAYPFPYPQNAFVYYRNAYPMMTFPPYQQRAMYQHAVFQNQQLRNYHRRSATSGVSAFASGDNIATGTQILKDDCRPADPGVSKYPSVQSFADAYPSEAVPENEIALGDDGGVLEQDLGTASELDFPIEDEEPLEDVPVVPTIVSDKRKKKVTVQLDSGSTEEEQEEPADEVSFGTRRGSGGRPAAAGGPMFPVTFGSTNGGAIAIANSYSTGKGGSATSHATAYGSPASVPEERRRAVSLQQQQQQQFRNNRPSKLRTKY